MHATYFKVLLKWFDLLTILYFLFVVCVDGEFEQLEITPLSSPPELPDVMKQQDSTSAHAQEQTAS